MPNERSKALWRKIPEGNSGVKPIPPKYAIRDTISLHPIEKVRLLKQDIIKTISLVPILFGMTLCLSTGTAQNALQPPPETVGPPAPTYAVQAPEPAPAISLVRPDTSGKRSEIQRRIDELLEGLGIPPLPSQYRSAYPSETIVSIKPSKGLGIVETILYSSVGEDFIGRFDNIGIFPGAIIDCMPYVRGDLNAGGDMLSDLMRHQYGVNLSSLSMVNAQDSPTTKVQTRVDIDGNVRQDVQGNSLQDRVRKELLSGKFSSPGLVKVNISYARTYAEAESRLGLSASGGGFTASLDANRNAQSDKLLFVAMVQQEYYRLSAAPSGKQKSVQGSGAWIVDTHENLERLQKLAISDLPRKLPGIPALIKEVRYGRIILLAFEIDIKNSRSTDTMKAGGTAWGTRLDSSYLTRSVDQLNGGAVTLIVYGGGQLPSVPPSLVAQPQPDDKAMGTTILTGNIDKQQAIRYLEDIISQGSEWSSARLGMPIGLTFELVGGTTLKPLNSSLTEMARTIGDVREGWNLALDCHVLNDFDNQGSPQDSGEWDIKLTRQSNGTPILTAGADADAPQHGRRSPEHSRHLTVTAPTDLATLYGALPLPRPVAWGDGIGGFRLHIRDCDAARIRTSADDHKFINFDIDMKVEEPKSFRNAGKSLEDVMTDLQSLSELFKYARRLEGANHSYESQKPIYDDWKQHLSQMNSQVNAMAGKLEDLKRLTAIAVRELNNVQNGGGPPVTRTAEGNTYTITGRPILVDYIWYLETSAAACHATFQSIKNYLNENRAAVQ